MIINSLFKSCDELFSGRKGTTFNAENNHREYLRRFRVTLQNNEIAKHLGSIGVGQCPGLPLAYSPYQSGNGLEYDLLALLVKAEGRQEHDHDWQSWIYDCHYSTRMPVGGQPQGVVGRNENPRNPKSAMNNPEMEPPDIEWDFESKQVAKPFDLDGRPFCNTAGQPFSPPPIFDEANAVLSMTRNEMDFNERVATRYAYAVNSDIFLGRKPGTVQCLPPKAKQIFRGSLSYWRVSYRLRFGPPKSNRPVNQIFRLGLEGLVPIEDAMNQLLKVPGDELEIWQPQILDAGTMEKLKNTGNPQRDGSLTQIFSVLGLPVTQPVLLDGKGGVQKERDANGQLIPHWVYFRVFQARPFKRLINKGFTL